MFDNQLIDHIYYDGDKLVMISDETIDKSKFTRINFSDIMMDFSVYKNKSSDN